MVDLRDLLGLIALQSPVGLTKQATYNVVLTFLKLNVALTFLKFGNNLFGRKTKFLSETQHMKIGMIDLFANNIFWN